jgi:hypothetical protein
VTPKPNRAELEAQLEALREEVRLRDQELVERVCRVAAELAQTRIRPYVEHQLGPWSGSGLAIPIGPQADPEAPSVTKKPRGY